MARTPYQDPQAEAIYQHGAGNPKYAGEIKANPMGDISKPVLQTAMADAMRNAMERRRATKK